MRRATSVSVIGFVRFQHFVLLQISVIRAAKESGLAVTCEAAPHHLFLTSSDVERIGATRSRVCPALVTQQDQDALWQNMDIIDCFATDHGKRARMECIFFC